MNSIQISSTDMAVLSLLRNALNNRAFELQGHVDWEKIGSAARKHMILPLVHKGAALLPALQRPPEQLQKAWVNYTIGSVLRGDQLKSAQEEIIAQLTAADIPCAVLKGTSVAALYPDPELRSLGDIDLLVRRKQCQDAVDVLKANGFHEHESDHAFHIGFEKDNVYLELHYAVTEFPDSPAGDYIRNKLCDAISRIKVIHWESHQIPVLSEPDQALALLLHMERHLVASGIGLKQLCDWHVFMHSLREDTLRNQVLPAIDACRLLQFARIATRICIDYLGLDREKHRWCEQAARDTADMFLADILSSGNIFGGDLERAASSVFVKGEESSKRKATMLISAVRNLAVSARKQFPVSTKVPVLLPFFCIYIPVRYWFRSMKGARPKQSVRKIAAYAWKRKRLYRRLSLFKK